MKFLLNVNVPPRLEASLISLGYQARHTLKVGLSRASDDQIIENARKSGEVIITNDLDYGQLLAFEKTGKPSVIIFRLHNNHPDRLFRLLKELLDQEKESIEKGAIVIVEETSIRIRALPIIKE